MIVTSLTAVCLAAVMNWAYAALGGGIYAFVGIADGMADSMDRLSDGFCPSGAIKLIAKEESENQSTASWRMHCVGYWVIYLGVKTLAAALTSGASGGGLGTAWQWYTGTSAEGGSPTKREEQTFKYMTQGNDTIMVVDNDLDDVFISSRLNKRSDEWTVLSYNYFIPVDPLMASENAVKAIQNNFTSYPLTFSHKHSNGTIVLTATTRDDLHDVLNEFYAWTSTTTDVVEKRSNAQYLSCTIDGVNVGYSDWLVIADYPDNGGGSNAWDNAVAVGRLLTASDGNSPYGVSVPAKFCFTLGESSARMNRNIFLGEMYVNAYGGFDQDCITG